MFVDKMDINVQFNSDDIDSSRVTIEDSALERQTYTSSNAIRRTKLVPVNRWGFKHSMFMEKMYKSARHTALYDDRTKAIVILNAVRRSDISYVKNWPRLHFDLECDDGIVSKSRLKGNQYLIVSPKSEPQTKHLGNFICLLCDVSFDVLSDLEKHTVLHGELPEETKDTDFEEEPKKRPEYVRKIEAFECTICLKFYRTISETEEHITCEHIEINITPRSVENGPKNSKEQATVYQVSDDEERDIIECCDGVNETNKSKNDTNAQNDKLGAESLQNGFGNGQHMKGNSSVKLIKENETNERPTEFGTLPIDPSASVSSYRVIASMDVSDSEPEVLDDMPSHDILDSSIVRNQNDGALSGATQDSNEKGANSDIGLYLHCDTEENNSEAEHSESVDTTIYDTRDSVSDYVGEDAGSGTTYFEACNTANDLTHKIYRNEGNSDNSLQQKDHGKKPGAGLTEDKNIRNETEVNTAKKSQEDIFQLPVDNAKSPSAKTSYEAPAAESDAKEQKDFIGYKGNLDKFEKCGNLQCVFCSKLFTESYSLSRHIKEVHKQGHRLQCKFCTKSFARRDHVVRHIKNIHKIPKCISCNKYFKTFEKLQEHVKVVHCGEDSDKKTSAAIAIKTVEPQLCHPNTQNASGGKDYSRIETNNTKMTQEQEFSSSTKEGVSEENSNMSENEERFHCNFCTKSYKRRKHLSRHLRQVHTENKIQSRFCKKSFKRREQNPMLLHSKKMHKQQLCETCNVSFETFDRLRDHVKAVHPSEQSNEDKSVDTSTKTDERSENTSFSKDNDFVNKADSLNEVLCHPLDSRNDPSTETSPVSTTRETQREQFQCRLCRKLFKSQKLVSRHVREVHMEEHKKLQCRFCTKLFKRRQHLNRHSKNMHKKPFCDSCKVKFETFDKLHDHVKAIHYVQQSSHDVGLVTTDSESNKNKQLVKCLDDDRESSHKYRVQKVQSGGAIGCSESVKKVLNDNVSSDDNTICEIPDSDPEPDEDAINTELINPPNDLPCPIEQKHYPDQKNSDETQNLNPGENQNVNENENIATSKTVKHLENNSVEQDKSGVYDLNSDKKIDTRSNDMLPLPVSLKMDLSTESASFNLFSEPQKKTQAEVHTSQRSGKDEQQKPKFKCIFCIKSFSRRYRMFRHVTKSHRERNCVICKQDFETVGQFHDHVKDVHYLEPGVSKPNHTCLVCKFEASNSELIKQHFLQQHSHLELYYCSACGDCESSITNIQLHVEKMCQKRDISDHSSEKEWAKKWRCSVCEADFETETDLNSHWESDHITTKKLYKCPKCKMSFTLRVNLQRHMEDHDSKRSETCKICNFSSDSKKKMSAHRFQHCNRMPITCSTCRRGFVSNDTYSGHKTKNNKLCHKGSPMLQEGVPYRCTECDITLTCDIKDYNEHFKTIHLQRDKRRLIICATCGKSLGSLQALEQHKLRFHSSLKNSVKCDVCNKLYPTEAIMRRHKHQRHLENNVPCEICGVVLKHRNHYNRHMKIVHCANDNIKCERCSKKFRSAFHVNLHMKRVHVYSHPEFECPECFRAFKTNCLLKKHIECVHTTERKFKCSICSKTFKSKDSLSNHRKLHLDERKFECEICQEQFKLNHHLKTHMLKHTGERAFKCKTCDKSFSRKQILETHMLTHTGEKAFVCEHCEKSFYRQTDLNRHMRLNHYGD